MDEVLTSLTNIAMGLKAGYSFQGIWCFNSGEMNHLSRETSSAKNIWSRRHNLFLLSLSLDFLEIAFRISSRRRLTYYWLLPRESASINIIPPTSISKIVINKISIIAKNIGKCINNKTVTLSSNYNFKHHHYVCVRHLSIYLGKGSKFFNGICHEARV